MSGLEQLKSILVTVRITSQTTNECVHNLYTHKINPRYVVQTATYAITLLIVYLL